MKSPVLNRYSCSKKESQLAETLAMWAMVDKILASPAVCCAALVSVCVVR